MILSPFGKTSQFGPLHHELHVLKDGQFCTPGSTPGVQVAKLSIGNYKVMELKLMKHDGALKDLAGQLKEF